MQGSRELLDQKLPPATSKNSQDSDSAPAPHAMGNPGLLYNLTSNNLNYFKHPTEPFEDARLWEILVQHLLTLISTQLVCSAAAKISCVWNQTGRAEPQGCAAWCLGNTLIYLNYAHMQKNPSYPFQGRRYGEASLTLDAGPLVMHHLNNVKDPLNPLQVPLRTPALQHLRCKLQTSVSSRKRVCDQITADELARTPQLEQACAPSFCLS